MASFRIPVLPLWMLLTALTSGCSDASKPGLDILEIEGVSWACNVTTSYALFGSSVENEEDLKITLPASEGDLLYMLQDDLQVYHRYSPSDGTHYAVSFDTMQAVSAYLNGQLSYMELSSPGSLNAFERMSEAEMEQLSALYIADIPAEDLLPVLNQHKSSLPGTGLILENKQGSGRLQDLLAIVRPRFLIMDDSWILPDPEEHLSLSTLEVLWIDGNIGALEKLARCCSNLESLIVSGWEAQPGELLPLAELNHLKSLTVAESSLTSLSSLDLPESLRNLYLISCDTLSDINGLSELKDLNSLSLAQCPKLRDPGLLKDMTSLKHLSLPPGINHQEFRELAQELKELELVELIDCPEIQDLSPLQELPELRILQLQLDPEQLGKLEDLDQLELVVLKREIFDDNPDLIKELKSSLPNTKIVPGSGICLGSGWFLLLIPLIWLFRYVPPLLKSDSARE